MQFGLAFTFPFRGREWFRKMVFAGLVSLIPVVGPLVALGWGMEISRRVIRREAEALPDLRFGYFLREGFVGAVILLVYLLPVFLSLSCLSAGVYLPPSIDLPENSAVPLAAGLGACLGCLSLLVSLVALLSISAAFGSYASGGRIGAAFRMRDVIGLVRAAPAAYFLLLPGALLLLFFGSLGWTACCVGLLITEPYALAAGFHLIGQAYTAAGSKPAASLDVIGNP